MLNICHIRRWYNIATTKVYRVCGQCVTLFFSPSLSYSEYTAYIAFKIHHLEFGISVNCTLISLNTNYTPWIINWQPLLQILLAGSYLPPHTGVLLLTIGLPTLPSDNEGSTGQSFVLPWTNMQEFRTVTTADTPLSKNEIILRALTDFCCCCAVDLTKLLG
jgi:hypothetical protein